MSKTKNIVKCFGRCQLVHTGKTKLKHQTLRQGMSSEEVKLKIDKLYHVRCSRCERGSWTEVPPNVQGKVEGPNIPLMDAIEDQLNQVVDSPADPQAKAAAIRLLKLAAAIV